MQELGFKREAAAEYDRAFAHVTRYFMPFVLRAAHIAQGMRVLDIAAGTGLSAEVALSAVGPTGHLTAADISPFMAEKARERLGEAAMLPFWSRMHRLSRSQTRLSTQWSAISG